MTLGHEYSAISSFKHDSIKVVQTQLKNTKLFKHN